MNTFLKKNQKAAKAMERFAEFKESGYPLIVDDLKPSSSTNNKKKESQVNESECSR